MKTIYQVIISAMLSGLIVFLSKLFYLNGGEFFLRLGIMLEIFVNGFILLVFPTGDDYYSLPNGFEMLLNIIGYSLLIFISIKAGLDITKNLSAH